MRKDEYINLVAVITYLICAVATNLLKISLLGTFKNIHKESRLSKANWLSIIKATLVTFTVLSGARDVAERIW